MLDSVNTNNPNAPRIWKWPWRKSRYGLALFHFVSLLAGFQALRLVLLLKFMPPGANPMAEVLGMLLVGAYADLCVGLVLTLPLLLWFAASPDRWFGKTWHRWLLAGGLFPFWLVQIFLLFLEFFFFDEFRSRFNTVAVDYLLYPHEVFVNIWEAYPVVKVVAACGLLAAAWCGLASWLFAGMWDAPSRRRTRWWGLAAVVAACALLIPAISLKGPRMSQDRLFNEMAQNGVVSFVSALITRHLEYTAFYRTLPEEEAYHRARQLLAASNARFTPEVNSIRRSMAGDSARPRLNVVLVLEESLGSEFWGSLGRKGPTLTPEMDRLGMRESLFFTNIYASGNRTVRGFEGVLSSFPPLPGDAIVKRDLSQNVETIARVLKRDGYGTLFLYGGRGLFDGMRSFAVNNGYDRFIERKHFKKPTFTTVWGVCDEDLFARTIEECRDEAKTGHPFLATVLSVSNHKPFTYPKGRILEDPDERQRANAVRYSDYALGRFFDAARRESFWNNTIFVVVADHGARVYGSQSIPIHSYEIPLIIAGPAAVKEPARIPALGCSLDVAPTILGILGRPYETLFFGRDLLNSPPEDGRALLNHNRDVGLFAHDRMVVLGMKQAVEFYKGDPKQVDLQPMTKPTPREEGLAKDAMALYQVADDLYAHLRYRIDK